MKKNIYNVNLINRGCSLNFNKKKFSQGEWISTKNLYFVVLLSLVHPKVWILAKNKITPVSFTRFLNLLNP